MEQIPLREFESAFPSRDEAARALRVTRQTLYNWEKAGGLIPELMSYRAREILNGIDTGKKKPRP